MNVDGISTSMLQHEASSLGLELVAAFTPSRRIFDVKRNGHTLVHGLSQAEVVVWLAGYRAAKSTT